MISWQQPIVLTKLKEITTTRLVFLILPYTCLMIRRKSSLRWGKTTWETFTSCQPWRSQTQLLEFFGSRDKIAQGKMQMQDGMPDGSLLLVPSDPIVDPFLPSNLDVVRFGDGAELTVSELTEFKDHLTFSTNFLNGQVTLPVTGKYNATNAMVAAYVYNANPTAMKLILETFSAIPKNEGGKKIAVLADMKELGEQSVQLHTQMILSLTPDAIDTVIFYGEDIAELSQLASQMFPLGHVYYFKKTADEDQFDAMVKQIKESLGEHDQILLKGSNSMNLAKVVEELQAKD